MYACWVAFFTQARCGSFFHTPTPTSHPDTPAAIRGSINPPSDAISCCSATSDATRSLNTPSAASTPSHTPTPPAYISSSMCATVDSIGAYRGSTIYRATCATSGGNVTASRPPVWLVLVGVFWCWWVCFGVGGCVLVRHACHGTVFMVVLLHAYTIHTTPHHTHHTKSHTPNHTHHLPTHPHAHHTHTTYQVQQ